MPKTSDSDMKTAMVQPVVHPVVAPQPKEYPPNIPKAKADGTNLPVAGGGFPDDSEFSGTYTKISDGEDYALAVVENDPLDRSHKAKNTVHSWEGTKEEFRAQFDVKDNDKRAPKDDDK